MKIDKPILAWTIVDLELLRNDPYNLEDINIEYKEQYSGNPDELRKDIVSFANSEEGGYILYGIRDDPFELTGINRSQLDSIKNAIDSIINIKIDPHLDPPPATNPIHLSDGLYVLGVQIFQKKRGLHAIRKINNPNNPDFRSYSFWIRSDGRKRQISMEEVNSYIIKTDPYKKYINVNVDFGLIGEPGKVEEIISVRGVNKSIRPITVSSYGFSILDKKDNTWFNIWLPAPNSRDPTTKFNTLLGTKLLDGEGCSGYYPTTMFREFLFTHDLKLPTKIKGFVNSNDGFFYSKEKDLNKEMISELPANS
ncbi:MAG: AlbA family DNA-binding domain-containing protein [Promethearchaeota archaeon]